MHVCGFPLALRRIPHVAFDWARHPLRLLQSGPIRPLHLAYFSCERDYDLLCVSLLSVVRIESALPLHSVTVVIDEKAPFSVSQRATLQNICSRIRFCDSIGEIHDRSTKTIRTELNAFGDIAAHSGPDAVIAKVDSDVLFFSPHKLRHILCSRCDFIGDTHWTNGAFVQGGLYLLSTRLAAALAKNTSDKRIAAACRATGSCAEDRVISALAKSHQPRMWLTNLMLFPTEYERVRLDTFFIQREFSAIHFFGCKSAMPHYFFQHLHDGSLPTLESSMRSVGEPPDRPDSATAMT